MRYLIIALLGTTIFFSCKKSDGNSAPKIKFKSITEEIFGGASAGSIIPILTIQVSDDDGDLGFNDGKDTSYIFIKNLTVAPFRMDSFKFPSSLSSLPKTAFKAYQDVDIDLNGNKALGPGRSLAYASTVLTTIPRRDSAFYEVYVKDFGKNKSNVIKTDKPLVFVTR
jgi:hypothetical protein